MPILHQVDDELHFETSPEQAKLAMLDIKADS